MPTAKSKSPATKKAPAGCQCVAKVNEKLKAYNTRLMQYPTANLTSGKMSLHLCLEIASVKIDSRIRAAKKKVMPTFCPFCGKKLA